MKKCNAGDAGSIPGSGRSPGEGNGNPLQYSCLGNLTDRGAWRATVHGVEKYLIACHRRSQNASDALGATEDAADVQGVKGKDNGSSYSQRAPPALRPVVRVFWVLAHLLLIRY